MQFLLCLDSFGKIILLSASGLDPNKHWAGRKLHKHTRGGWILQEMFHLSFTRQCPGSRLHWGEEKKV